MSATACHEPAKTPIDAKDPAAVIPDGNTVDGSDDPDAPDAIADAEIDAAPDARPDAAIDARPDAAPDARPDAPIDARPDAPMT